MKVGTVATKPDPRSKKAPLSRETLALVRSSMDLVRLAEDRIRDDIRNDRDTALSIDIHHNLRIASLGLLVSYSLIEGYDDPRTEHFTGVAP